MTEAQMSKLSFFAFKILCGSGAWRAKRNLDAALVHKTSQKPKQRLPRKLPLSVLKNDLKNTHKTRSVLP